MKITYIENIRFPSERAHSIQIFHTCQELGVLGYEVVLVTPARQGRGRYEHLFSEKLPAFSHVLLPVLDVLALSFVPRRIAYYLERWSFFRACRTWKQNQKSDVWYTRDLYVVWALFGSSDVWVVELHNAPNLFLWKRTRACVKKYVVISHALEAWLLDQGVAREDIVVAPDGWDPSSLPTGFDREAVRRELGWKKDETIFIYAGGLFPWKGVDQLVKWWNAHPPTGAKLVILGGAEVDKARIATLFTTHSIQMLGTVSPTEVSRFLSAADVGVLPTSPDYEIGRLYTSPLKLFEYLAMGLPIIATNVPSSREILDESVAKFFINQSSFDEACERAINDHVWKEEAQKQARAKSALYTWNVRTKKIQSCIEAAVTKI